MLKTNHFIRLLWVILLVVCLHTISTKAQDTTAVSVQDTTIFFPKAANTIYAELFGNGGYYSLNYERHIDSHWSARIGFSNITFLHSNEKSFPLSASYLFNYGTSHDHLELGLGLTPTWIDSSPYLGLHFQMVLCPMVGYRFQSQKGGLNVRILATPLIYLIDTLQRYFQLWGGLSIGYTF